MDESARSDLVKESIQIQTRLTNLTNRPTMAWSLNQRDDERSKKGGEMMELLKFNKTGRWKRKPPNRPLIFFSLSLLFSLFLLFLLFAPNKSTPKPLLSAPDKTLTNPHIQFPQCRTQTQSLQRETFLWYAPHSGFSNQLSEFKNAILMAAILKRTLIVPPILDHHAVTLGSCPKFRVSSPVELRIAVWNHFLDLIQGRRFVSMVDIIDISSVASMVQTIDLRDFASSWCGVNRDVTCMDEQNAQSYSFDKLKQCGSLISGLVGNVDLCLYALDEDCRTTVWTYQQNDEDGLLDSFQPDEKLQKKKNISYVRRRQDVSKNLGAGSKAELSTVLAWGSLFTAPYKGSELFIDIHEAPRDQRIQSLIQKLEFLPFVPEITNAGKEFAHETIKAPFLCAQLRLLDGQFKNHWKNTFLGLKQKVEYLRQKGSLPISIFVMTDLPEANWTGSYLGDLARDSDSFKLHILREGDELVKQTAKEVLGQRHGMKFRAISKGSVGASEMKKYCLTQNLPDILLYIEETVCSCGSLGFVGTAGSTIAENIELMRKFGVCLHQSQT